MSYKYFFKENFNKFLLQFPWKNYIVDGIANSLSNLNVNEDETVIVYNWNYISKVADIYNQYSTTKKRYFYLIYVQF